jgi:DNA (cytosine-5)-methyltransferase 1
MISRLITNSDHYRNMLKGKKFIDLFAGIGSTRYALEAFGAECVFSSEINEHCQEVYKANHGDMPHGDITRILASDIPKHDIICAGFPCQSFSISGNMKGLNDSRVMLFYEVARIAAYHEPELLVLENVGNLLTHDNGRTLRVIKETLENIGYDVNYEVLNSSAFGVPQSRERIFIICTLNRLAPSFPYPLNYSVSLQDILQDADETRKYEIDLGRFADSLELDRSPKKLELAPIRIGKIQGGRQGERIYSTRGHAITLSSGGGGIGAKTGLYLVGDVVRRLSPRECARLTGLPETFVLPASDCQAYAQLGNSLVADVVQYIMIEHGRSSLWD